MLNFDGLRDKFGDRLVLETDSFTEYFRDASEITVKAPAIIFPDTEEEVIQINKYCRESNIPIVFRGAGTGYTGGAVPVPDCLILSLEHLKKLEVDPAGKRAFCGPGIITINVMKAAEKHNLFYPPDPASYDESTLGGNVAECAGGLHCKKYGVTKDYIIGLRAVTIDGALIKTGIYSESDLFDLSGIIIGSEGILAAVTEIAVRLIDLPPFGPTILAAFGRSNDAARLVADITLRGIVPSVMEYMDGDSVRCSNSYEKSIEIEDAAAILLIETSGRNCGREADEIENICRQYDAIYLKREDDRDRAEHLWKIRRNLSRAVKESARHKISEDVCVPPSKLPELVDFVARLNEESPVRINSYGHAGDGNLHVNFLAASDENDELALIDRDIKRLFEKTLCLGGTLTGEHGIGLTKKDFLHLEFNSATIDHMLKVKQVFDHDFLLNPGKMFKSI
ncbi:MAG TPA: FAD-binding protein [candidate division Zixibacteria bacterium]|nr:FAD-binding protein [candidate division Zixibacteria bacterium]